MKNNLKPEENVNCGITTEIIKHPNENEWKDIGKVSGIYKIINKINGKYYVGSSKNINYGYHSRWNRHKRDLNKKIHRNDHLQRSWDKYGEDNFDWVLVEKIPEEKLVETEQKYLDIAKTEQDKCYNTMFTVGIIVMDDNIKQKLSNLAKKRFLENGSPIKGKPISKEKKELLKKISSHPKEKNGRYDHTLYTFYNELTKEYFTGTKFQFRTKFKIDRSFLWMLIKGKYKLIKGWRLSTPRITPPLCQQ
jgi:group I intron endonuclease